MNNPVRARYFLLGGLPVVALLLAGCRGNPGVSDRDTGGGAISRYEGHSALRHDALGTGNSSGARDQGPVPGSGAPGEPGNAHSPSESNGGRPLPN